MAELDFISKFSGEEIDNILDKSQELLNKGYTFSGVATPDTDPGTPLLKVFYLTTTDGEYANFGNIIVESGKLTVLLYNGSTWEKQVLDLPTSGGGSTVNVVQTTGTSMTDVMSQKAVTDELDKRQMAPATVGQVGQVLTQTGPNAEDVSWQTPSGGGVSPSGHINVSLGTSDVVDLSFGPKGFPGKVPVSNRAINLTVEFNCKHSSLTFTLLYKYIGARTSDSDWYNEANWENVTSNIDLGTFDSTPTRSQIWNLITGRAIRQGVLLSYTVAGHPVIERYLGSDNLYKSFKNKSNFQIVSISDNMFVPWQGTRSDTRYYVFQAAKFGMTICYDEGGCNFTKETFCFDAIAKLASGYRYPSTGLSEAYWRSDYFWKKIGAEPAIAKGIPCDGGICITGASFAAASENGWFEHACEKLGVTAYNKASSGTNICDTAQKMRTGTLFSTEEFEAFATFVIFHVHDKDVYSLRQISVGDTTYSKEDLLIMSVEEYESSGILDLLTPVTGYTPTDNIYAIAFDYVIKKYKSLCAESNKPISMVLMTNWNDGRAVYNRSVRDLAIRHSIPLMNIDEYLTKNLSDLYNHPSIPFARDFEGENSLGAAFQYGKHLIYEKEGDQLPYPQKWLAGIFASSFIKL